jgi:DNA transformation protein
MSGHFNDLLEELFAPLGGVSLRRMFGGIGVFKEGIMFGLVADDVLYLKADDATTPAYEAEGRGPFVYQGSKGKPAAMPYWQVPDRLLDEPDEFQEWAAAAFDVAVRTAKPKKKKAPKRRVKSP